MAFLKLTLVSLDLHASGLFKRSISDSLGQSTMVSQFHHEDADVNRSQGCADYGTN
jgi:hypothetical protein